MADKHDGEKKGVSLAKGPIGIIGLILLAWGVITLLKGGFHFSTASIPSGRLRFDEKFLGIGANDWTALLAAGSGLLLLLSAPLHWGAKTIGMIVGLVLGAASVIMLSDKDDVFGIFAGNGPTKLALGAASAALLVLSLLPRVGKKDRADDDTRTRDRDADLAPRRTVREERVVEREPRPTQREATVTDRHVVSEGEGRTGRFERELDPRDENLTDRDRAGSVSRRDERL